MIRVLRPLCLMRDPWLLTFFSIFSLSSLMSLLAELTVIPCHQISVRPAARTRLAGLTLAQTTNRRRSLMLHRTVQLNPASRGTFILALLVFQFARQSCPSRELGIALNRTGSTQIAPNLALKNFMPPLLQTASAPYTSPGFHRHLASRSPGRNMFDERLPNSVFCGLRKGRNLL